MRNYRMPTKDIVGIAIGASALSSALLAIWLESGQWAGSAAVLFVAAVMVLSAPL